MAYQKLQAGKAFTVNPSDNTGLPDPGLKGPSGATTGTGGGGTQNLPRLIGPSLAKELIWTGRRITAREALEYRIVNHVVRQGSALKKAREIVREMEQNGPLGIMMSKQAINRGLDQSRFNGFLAEGDLAHMLNFSEDRPEGLQAFAERRKPNFKGQ